MMHQMGGYTCIGWVVAGLIVGLLAFFMWEEQQRKKEDEDDK